MDLTGLTTLKQKLIQAKDFKQIWEYFMDHFGENPDFLALGERTEQPLLEAILGQVGQQLLGRPVSPSQLLLLRLPEQKFLHGACTLGGKPANILYFEDIQMGLLTVIISFKPSETKLIRFSGRTVPAPRTSTLS